MKRDSTWTKDCLPYVQRQFSLSTIASTIKTCGTHPGGKKDVILPSQTTGRRSDEQPEDPEPRPYIPSLALALVRLEVGQEPVDPQGCGEFHDRLDDDHERQHAVRLPIDGHQADEQVPGFETDLLSPDGVQLEQRVLGQPARPIVIRQRRELVIGDRVRPPGLKDDPIHKDVKHITKETRRLFRVGFFTRMHRVDRSVLTRLYEGDYDGDDGQQREPRPDHGLGEEIRVQGVFGVGDERVEVPVRVDAPGEEHEDVEDESEGPAEGRVFTHGGDCDR